eukprot:g16157.t1
MIVNRFWIRSGPCVRGSFCWWTGKRHFSLNTNNDYVVSEQDYEAFHRDGYVTLKNVMTEEEMQQIERVYDEFNEGKRDGIDFGNDIGDMSQGQDALPEDFNMININIPCTHDPTWANNIFEQKARFISQQLHGKDMEKDYEQLLTKLPCRPNAVFPMHQDMAYWPKKSNIRTDTCTVSLAVNDANVENGCLVVLPGSQAEKRLYGDHFAIVEEDEGERAIELELRAGDNEKLQPCPVLRGDVTVHDEWIVHGSSGNASEVPRKTYVVAFRDKSMINYERQNGFHHSYNDDPEVLKRIREGII